MNLTTLCRFLLRTLFACIFLFPVLLGAQSVELKVEKATLNLNSQGGLALSVEKNKPPGSNGNAPDKATDGQFGGYMAVGSSASPANPSNLSNGSSYFDNSKNIGLPRSKDGELVLTRATVGAPYFGRRVSMKFGEIVHKPTEIGEGADKIKISDPSIFWEDEPFIPSFYIKSVEQLNGIATVVTKTKHNFIPGDLVLVSGITGVSADQYAVIEVPVVTDQSTDTEKANDEKVFKINLGMDPSKRVFDSLDATANSEKPEAEPMGITQGMVGLVRLAHESLGYYYSKSVTMPVLIKPGPVNITWRRRNGKEEVPAGEDGSSWKRINANGVVVSSEDEGIWYEIYPKSYMVSASLVKDPQVIYWNKEPLFDGPLVPLPEGLGDVHIVYSKLFPKMINPAKAQGKRETGTGQSADQELRTLWVDKVSPQLRLMMALNVTGKVVIELLGDTRPDGNREHLGFEIVDVQKYSIPSDTVLDLGARVQPSVEGKPVLDASLKADMRDNGVAAGSPFTLQYTLPGANQLTYFAIKETNNKNDVVAFWMKKSIAGIAWPLYHNRYHLQWPDNSEDYSHYVRPRVTQDNGLVGLSGSLLEEGKQEAKESAVQLPMETTPKLQYQDLDSMGQERAFLSGGDKKFFTLMDTHFPTHRTLLSYETAAGGIAFEHVLSWLDESIKDGQWPNEDQTAHLVEWPKMQVTEAQGVPTTAQGSILVRVFTSLEREEAHISSLTKDKDFPMYPTEESALPYFEYPNENDREVPGNNAHNNYGAQVVGYFHPSKTGWYRFGLDANENGQLWLSTDSSAENKRLIASQPESSSGPRQFSGSQSDAIKLKKGRAYYIETIHQATSVDDHVSVAFSYGTDKEVPNIADGALPVDGQYLSPWVSRWDISGGLKVSKLGYDFEPGDVIEFSGGGRFTFTEAASKEDTRVHGNLVGIVRGNEIGVRPTPLSIAPEVRVNMTRGENKALQFEKSKKQNMTAAIELPDTDQTIEFLFRTTDPNAGLFEAYDAENQDRKIFLKDGEIKAQVWNGLEEKQLTIGASGLELDDGIWHHAALTISTGDITRPEDTVWHTSELPNDSHPATHAIDNDLETTYYHKVDSSGLIVHTRGGIVNAVALTSAANLPSGSGLASPAAMDPAEFQLFGSNNGGESFALIHSESSIKFKNRQERVLVSIPNNAKDYRIYKLVFPTPTVSLFSEKFDSLKLGPFESKTEKDGDGTDWTATLPDGWVMNKGNTHGTTNGGNDVPEFDGWTFVDPVSWNATAGQDRSKFTLGEGVIVVADSDEYDDNDDAKFEASLSTPEIYIPDVAPGDLTLNFYSSWKRGNSHYGQVIVTYGDGTPVGPNLAGNDNWLAGTGNALSASENPNTKKFQISGDGNLREYGEGPFGVNSVIWVSRDNEKGGDFKDGGWTKEVPIDSKKAYMSIVYIKRVKGDDGYFEHKCTNGYSYFNFNQTVNSTLGGRFRDLPLNEWVVSIGVIRDENNNKTTVEDSMSGIFVVSSGKKLSSNKVIKMNARRGTTQSHQVKLNFSDNGEEIHWARPGFYEINGSEPSLFDLTKGKYVALSESPQADSKSNINYSFSGENKLNLKNPEGAKNAVITWYSRGHNDGWWAIDNVSVNAPLASDPGLTSDVQVAEVELIGNTQLQGISLYVDGEEVASGEQSVTSSGLTSQAGVRFGYAHDSNYLNGEIDEVRIWNVARSEGQISRYDKALLPASELGLMANYSFDRVDSNSIADLAGIHDATLKNYSDGGTLNLGMDLTSAIRLEPLKVGAETGKLVFGDAVFEVATPAKKGDTEIMGYLSGTIKQGEIASLSDSTVMFGPRYVERKVKLGARINAPVDERGAINTGQSYWAGYIHSGTAYNRNAYINPLGPAGFTGANGGSIIPVNSDPANNKFTIYWFRQELAKQDPKLGYKPVYWPSVVGYYTIEEPTSPRTIILASNDGSGPLSSLEQKGSIYRQPSRKMNGNLAPGYNPNEEHAVLLGGQVWALRCDLNQDGRSGLKYTSPPFVLLEYVDSDSRISMSVFEVLPEKPDEGILFDYITEAGKVLQAPMPLPLLDKPVHKDITAATSVGKMVGDLMDREFAYPKPDVPDEWNEVDAHNLEHYKAFTAMDRNNTTWVYRGRHKGKPDLEIGTYSNENFGDLIDATAVAGEPFVYHLHSSLWAEHLQMVAGDEAKWAESAPWLIIEGLSLKGTPSASDVGKVIKLDLVVNSEDGDSVSKTIGIRVVRFGQVVTQGKLVGLLGESRYTGRAPYLSEKAGAANSFRMKYWYKNLAEFDWPSDEDSFLDNGEYSEYEVGKNIQYLSTPNNVAGKTIRDHGDLDYVVYRPVWPASAPKIMRAETLTLPKFGLPAMRGQTSVKVLYQQSVADNKIDINGKREFKYYSRDTEDVLQVNGSTGQIEEEIIEEGWATSEHGSVILHDPTREKVYNIPDGVDFPPADVLTSRYQGNIYFPKLPPHLNKRLFFNPNMGKNGALVFRGEFRDEIVGVKYLLLNLISDNDKPTLLDFSSDSAWDEAIQGLSTRMVEFIPKRRDDGTVIPGMFNENKLVDIAYNNVTEAEIENTPVDSYALSAAGPESGYVTLMVGNGNGKVTPESDPVSMHIIKVEPTLYQGELKVIYSDNPMDEKVSLRHDGDFGGKFKGYEFQWHKGYPVDGASPKVMVDGKLNSQWIFVESASGTGKNSFVHGAGAVGVDTIKDVYYILRYRPVDGSDDAWSDWTKPKFTEGWIKRVLAGINPFNQRLKDLFSNKVNTDASILTQAGKRSEGDVALSIESINDFGLIEIYETVLNRGRMLSIDADINDMGANMALQLVAGYLNDLYMMLGNEAFADAANPTIGFGTADGQYGDIATALFAFKGQVSTLMGEELGLLRGRDDFLQPDVEVAPVYNRMIWNYTRGIDAGEVVYALNYNIKERNGEKLDGNVDAADASHMYPQGHGDAYGHYLTAIKGYYHLLADNDFEWVPQTEAVSILGQEVSVDYMDERKFAKTALALARTGQQVYELTWRQDYLPDTANGWAHMEKIKTNDRREYTSLDQSKKNPVRHWGQDHWAARVGSGSYLNWVVANSMIPAYDNDPAHEGIKKIDRTTVLELLELADIGRELQTTADHSATGLNPLGLPEDTVPFDISPDFVRGGAGEKQGHMDQMYGRAALALNNAVESFDASKNITQLMRTEEDSLADLQIAVDSQELAYKHRLIELYGTPYSDDIGPGKVYKQGYDGPDLLHYQYVGEGTLTGTKYNDSKMFRTYTIDRRALAADQKEAFASDFEDTLDSNTAHSGPFAKLSSGSGYGFAVDSLFTANDFAEDSQQTTTYTLDNHGFFVMPDYYSGKRSSPGELQFAIGNLDQAHGDLLEALVNVDSVRKKLDQQISLITSLRDMKLILLEITGDMAQSQLETAGANFAADISGKIRDNALNLADDVADLVTEAAPTQVIFGFSNGGNFLKVITAVPNGIKSGVKIGVAVADMVIQLASGTRELVHIENTADWEKAMQVAQDKQEIVEMLNAIEETTWALSNAELDVDTADRDYSTAVDRYRTMVASGDRILKEREISRKRSAAKVHGYRTRDAAFRVFRNEKLERYKSMFDLAARYTYFAAKSFDYETGLLGSDKGKRFLSRIVASRALGVVQDGTPQFAGSNTGDPGLSSVLAEMKADWDVLRGRLGINNPDTYGTTASLRTENHRILPGSAGETAWQDVLNNARKRDLLLDNDLKELCMQLANDNGLPVPGIVLEFSTTIADGYNLFGKSLASGDHNFSPTSFATKIMAVGVALDGYEGMDYTVADNGDGGSKIPVMLNPKGLSATPYVYLIPVGLDSMRSPPLGDRSVVRTWDVQDATIPMPFNIGGSEFETKKLWQTSDSLTEQMFNVRKHQAFRAVDTIDFFRNGPLVPPHNFTNNRLIGRSVWNSKWKLVIPGKTLLDDPEEGLDLFINTVKDIKIHFETYSYSGN